MIDPVTESTNRYYRERDEIVTVEEIESRAEEMIRGRCVGELIEAVLAHDGAVGLVLAALDRDTAAAIRVLERCAYSYIERIARAEERWKLI